ncbi:MAG: hypothetical protein K1X67_10380 [Fimbriimonadaceae bacterium]|nr:hypothetical protein [Fimbriimonadaceae bacterium]
MNTEDRAVRAQIALSIRKLTPTEFETCTTASGIASACRLAEAAIAGMWFFLGFQVDPVGLRPQPVRLLQFSHGDEPMFALVLDDRRRLIAASRVSADEVLNMLKGLQIDVAWAREADPD